MYGNANVPSENIRQTLKRALDAAQIAVKLDEADRDTMAIVEAYQRSISLLEDVIERNPLEDVEDLDEVEQLRAIRSSYRERVQVLLLSRTRSVPIARQSTDLKPWKFPSPNAQAAKARRWTMQRLKVLCFCSDGAVTL
ncbi:hypothetical protein DFH06DRAFT_1187120 [Mycena polygramma]|nr:hypothetical protein DFH06DRAFT_1187120 [Mycena polygramma]